MTILLGRCTLHFLENCHLLFQSGCPILYSHQQGMISNLSTSFSKLRVVSLFSLGHCKRCEWYVTVILIFISLKTNEFKSRIMSLSPSSHLSEITVQFFSHYLKWGQGHISAHNNNSITIYIYIKHYIYVYIMSPCEQHHKITPIGVICREFAFCLFVERCDF